MKKVQTDNSFFKEKVYLRNKYLPKKDLNVLNCFAGENKIWKEISKIFNYGIKTYNIDKKNIKGTVPGDNIKYLLSLDLSKFDIIDLDAYGSPFNQLNIIFKRKFKGDVFLTFIQSFMGSLNNEMLFELGYTKEMIDKAKILLSANGFEKFKQWLSIKGINKIHHYSNNRKHYAYIHIK